MSLAAAVSVSVRRSRARAYVRGLAASCHVTLVTEPAHICRQVPTAQLGRTEAPHETERDSMTTLETSIVQLPAGRARCWFDQRSGTKGIDRSAAFGKVVVETAGMQNPR